MPKSPLHADKYRLAFKLSAQKYVGERFLVHIIDLNQQKE